jgi:aspartate-semialdehyde dehydrogenase
MDPKVPLVVPEVNAHDLRRHNGLIANPNCTAAILAVAVWPIHQAVGIRRIVVSTYQAASGAGAAGMRELEDQMHEYADGKEITRSAFPHQIAQCLAQHRWLRTAPTRGETRWSRDAKMFRARSVGLPTCVPVLKAQSESVSPSRGADFEEARVTSLSPGIKITTIRPPPLPMPEPRTSTAHKCRPPRLPTPMAGKLFVMTAAHGAPERRDRRERRISPSRRT